MDSDPDRSTTKHKHGITGMHVGDADAVPRDSHRLHERAEGEIDLIGQRKT